MMAADLPEEYETSICIIAFKGEHEKWRQWKIKTKAIGMKKRWVEALENDYSCEGWSTLALTDDQKFDSFGSITRNYLVNMLLALWWLKSF
jgi:hypothetical protein